MDILHDFSTALLQARQRKQKTQEEVAWALGLSHATYNAWECGHRLCPYKHIVALITYFEDEQFSRQMIRILLRLQHQMIGWKPDTDAERIANYYRQMSVLIEDECEQWINTTLSAKKQ